MNTTGQVLWTLETIDSEGDIWTQTFTDEGGYDGQTDVAEICRAAEYEFDQGATEVTIRREKAGR